MLLEAHLREDAIRHRVRLEIKQMGQRLLVEQVKRVEEAGGTVAGAHFRMARPDQGILAVGEDIGTGLIVLGSRGLGGVKRALMGSVSDSVVRHAHRPVLVSAKKMILTNKRQIRRCSWLEMGKAMEMTDSELHRYWPARRATLLRPIRQTPPRDRKCASWEMGHVH